MKYTNKCPECGNSDWFYFTEDEIGFITHDTHDAMFMPPLVAENNNALIATRRDDCASFDMCARCYLVVS